MTDKTKFQAQGINESDTQTLDELKARALRRRTAMARKRSPPPSSLENYAINPVERARNGEVPLSIMGGHDRGTGEAVVAIRMGNGEVRMSPDHALGIAKGIRAAVAELAPDATEMPELSTMFEAVNDLVSGRDEAIDPLLTTLDQQGKIMGAWLRRRGFAEAAEELLVNNARANANILQTLTILRKTQQTRGPIASA